MSQTEIKGAQMNKRNSKVGIMVMSLMTFPVAASAQIEEIIVTAQKRAESIQDVPISITAFSGDFLEENNVRDLQGLSNYTANFQITSSGAPSNTTFSIRGVGSTGNNAIEPSVGVFVDGIYYPRAGSILGSLADIQTVEVLRGPQGTLFGRNTPVGALNITTRDPEEGFGIDGSFGYASFNDINGKATINAGGDRFGMRLSVGASSRDAWATNRFDGKDLKGRDEYYGRAKFLWDASPDLEVKLTLDKNRIQSGGNMVDYNGSVSPAGALAILDSMSTTYGNGMPFGETNHKDYKLNQINADDVNDEQWGAGLDVNWDIGEYRVRSITSYRDWDHLHDEEPIKLPMDFLRRETNYVNKTKSQEFQLISPAGADIEYILGAFYYHEEYEILRTMDLGADGCSFLQGVFGWAAGTVAACDANLGIQDSIFSQELDSFAVFGQATANVNEQISLTGGLRWTTDEKNASFDLVNTGSIVGPTFRAPESKSMSDSWDKLTWLINASYFMNDDVMFFATASTGFKSGGMNSEGVGPPALTVDQRLFDPEDVLDYELGMKSTLVDGKVIANVTLFQTELSDFQNRSFDGLSFVVLNAGDLVMRGLEADIQAQPSDRLSFTFSGAYLDTEFKSFKNASGLPGGPPQDLTGKGRHGSPKLSLSASTLWEDQLGNTDLNWFMGADIQHTSSQLYQDNLNPQSKIDAYSLLNFRLGLRAPGDEWQVSLYGRNITDNDHCLAQFGQALAGIFGMTDGVNNLDPMKCTLSEPRILGVQFSMSY